MKTPMLGWGTDAVDLLKIFDRSVTQREEEGEGDGGEDNNNDDDNNRNVGEVAE